MAAGVNKSVIIGAVGITTIGVVSAIIKDKPISGVIMGGYLVAVLGGVIDLFGGGASKLAGSIVMLALFATLVYEAGVLSNLLGMIQKPPPEPSPPEPPKS